MQIDHQLTIKLSFILNLAFDFVDLSPLSVAPFYDLVFGLNFSN
jgi:hypothetical protein